MNNLFEHAYPYSDFHELNLSWLIAKMKELNIKFDEFKVVNNITFSGAWDITKNYPAWTIVSDNNIGYVSIKPVPAGVVLTNTDYWIEVIDYTAQIAGLENRVIALENKVKQIITPEDFGAKGDGTEDDTQALQDWIDYGYSNKVPLICLENNIYRITGTLHIIDNDINFNGATIINDGSGYAIDIENTSADRESHIFNLTIDANSLSGIQVIKSYNSILENININNIGAVGISNDSGYETLFNNINLKGIKNRLEVGIKNNTSDCHYTNIHGVNLYTFIELNAWALLDKIHAWTADNAIYNGSTFIDCKSFNSLNITNSNCDTYSIAFKFYGNAPAGIVQNCEFMYHNGFISAGDDTYLLDCGADITSYSRYLDKLKFIGCRFSMPTVGSYHIAKNCSVDKYVPLCIDNCRGLADREGDYVDLTSLSNTTFNEGSIKIKYGFEMIINAKILLPANQQQIFEVPGTAYSCFAFNQVTTLTGMSDSEWDIDAVTKINVNSLSTNKTLDAKIIFTKATAKYITINVVVPLIPLT